MMLFGIRRLAAAQASARMLPRSLRTHATQSEKRGRPHGWRGSTELQRSVLMRVRPTSPSAFCLADSSCSGLVSISAAFSMSTGLFTRFCMRARPGADSSCAARETRHQSGRPAWAGALRGRGQVAGAHRPGGKGTPPWYFSTPYSIWQPALLRLMLSSRRPVRASTHLVVSSDQ